MRKSIVERICWTNERLGEFWSSSSGWAPPDAAELLSQVRHDWQLSLSQTLFIWLEKDVLSQGELILAWANLGALLEGSLKLLLCVYYEDYKRDPIFNWKKQEVSPDVAELEKLRVFFQRKGLLGTSALATVSSVQKYRNTIHAFHDRDIGDTEVFFRHLHQYLLLLDEINGRLPYPDEVGRFHILKDMEEL